LFQARSSVSCCTATPAKRCAVLSESPSQLHQLFAASISVAGLNNEHDILRRLASIARSVFDADQSIVSLERGRSPRYAYRFAKTSRPSRRCRRTLQVSTTYPSLRPKETSPWLDHEWLVAPISRKTEMCHWRHRRRTPVRSGLQ